MEAIKVIGKANSIMFPPIVVYNINIKLSHFFQSQ